VTTKLQISPVQQQCFTGTGRHCVLSWEQPGRQWPLSKRWRYLAASAPAVQPRLQKICCRDICQGPPFLCSMLRSFLYITTPLQLVHARLFFTFAHCVSSCLLVISTCAARVQAQDICIIQTAKAMHPKRVCNAMEKPGVSCTHASGAQNSKHLGISVPIAAPSYRVMQAMIGCTEVLLATQWRHSGSRDVYEDFNGLTLQITTQALFGDDLPPAEGVKVTGESFRWCSAQGDFLSHSYSTRMLSYRRHRGNMYSSTIARYARVFVKYCLCSRYQRSVAAVSFMRLRPHNKAHINIRPN